MIKMNIQLALKEAIFNKTLKINKKPIKIQFQHVFLPKNTGAPIKIPNKKSTAVVPFYNLIFRRKFPFYYGVAN